MALFRECAQNDRALREAQREIPQRIKPANPNDTATGAPPLKRGLCDQGSPSHPTAQRLLRRSTDARQRILWKTQL